jgi:succinoglycan biosynthesis transport protein ExoP
MEALAPRVEPAGSKDPVRVIHGALRGRYVWASILALIGGGLGAYAGHRFQAPQYRSEGLIRIAYVLPTVSTTIPEQNLPITMFDAFLRAQQLLMSSRTELEQAMKEPVWVSTAHGPEATNLADFAENLTVDHTPTTDLLHVYFASPDPNVAAAGVQAVINVYSRDYSDQESVFQQKLLNALGDEGTELSSRLQRLQDQLGAEVGSTDIEPQYQAALTRENELLAKLSSARRLIDVAHDSAPLTDPNQIIEQIGMTDPQIRQYMADRERLSDTLDQLKVGGFMPNHQSVQLVEQELAAVNQHIVDYAAGISANLKELNHEYDQVHEEVQQLAAKRMKGDALKNWLAQVGKDLADVTARSDAIKVEDRAGSRLNVISTGDVPMLPYRDRRLMFAAIGAAIGAIFPVGLLALVGLSRPRYRYSNDATTQMTSDIPLLGVLPTLRGPNDTEAQAGTAHCVHQMRVMLQVGKPRDYHPVFLMTSAAPGEGKTSLTAALGLSYAASGSRTLIIDADLIGRGLTNGFDCEGQPGFYEALQEGSINGFARQTATPDMWILPAGRTNGDGSGQLSLPPIQRLLNQIRGQFDVVLVDSGPILGSVEAAVISQDVDGVIFVVSRGQQVPLVQRALAQLRSVGARMSGLVFNRAGSREFARGGYASSLRTRRDQSGSYQGETTAVQKYRADSNPQADRNIHLQSPAGSA